MDKKKRAAIALLIIAAVLLLSSCAYDGSVAIVEKTPEQAFDISMKDWNGTDTVTLTLNAGDEVRVEISCKSGSIALEVSGQSGSMPYSGKDLKDMSFTITVEDTDTYTFKIKGSDTTGSLNIAH